MSLLKVGVAGLETYNIKVCMSYTFTPEEETGLQGFEEI
jgi:hypothetical protein